MVDVWKEQRARIDMVTIIIARAIVAFVGILIGCIIAEFVIWRKHRKGD